MLVQFLPVTARIRFWGGGWKETGSSGGWARGFGGGRRQNQGTPLVPHAEKWRLASVLAGRLDALGGNRPVRWSQWAPGAVGSHTSRCDEATLRLARGQAARSLAVHSGASGWTKSSPGKACPPFDNPAALSRIRAIGGHHETHQRHEKRAPSGPNRELACRVVGEFCSCPFLRLLCLFAANCLARRVVSGGANIDIFWRTRSRHGSEAPPMVKFTMGG
jgi:hypothetical protein